jgi:fructose-1,6-bisphosphatase/inositol monophosphatase family enzyme
MDKKFPAPGVLLDAGKKIAKTVFDVVESLEDRGTLRQKGQGGRHKSSSNITRKADLIAHQAAAEHIELLGELYDCDFLVLGEEKGTYPATLEGYEQIVAFLDPIDGTDLAVRGFSNWCFALTFFFPPERRILASIVGHSSGQIYYATEIGAFKGLVKVRNNESGQRVIVEEDKPLVINPKKITRLEDAAVCFYGQKPQSFLNLAENEGFIRMLREFSARMHDARDEQGNIIRKGERLEFRLYNLAGNPMMPKIADGAVDAVLGLSPSQVHDVIPGAFIATQAGAILRDLNGVSINPADCLMKPRQRVNYVVTGSEKLAEELVEILKSRPGK